jgi:hypothetical protein
MAGTQLKFEGFEETSRPTYEVFPEERMSPLAKANLEASGLSDLGVHSEEWSSDASNHALQYATHGVFRYFGKFPPPVARELIPRFTQPGQLVLDPMVGSGTTAVEAALLNRQCIAFDVNPLSVLLTRVKCTRLPAVPLFAQLESLLASVNKSGRRRKLAPAKWPTTIKLDHYFLPETSHWLQLIREGIDRIECPQSRDVFRVALASIIRRVSKATTQQGRLFLDVATAEPDPRPRFESSARDIITSISDLPKQLGSVSVTEGSAITVDFSAANAPLVICHPPYFNVYRYSRILSLESAWLDFPTADIRKKEVREFFKVGKPAKVTEYVSDMQAALSNVSSALTPDGTLALMVGDTVIHGERICTTKLLVDAVSEFLEPVGVNVRTPKYTEASWAASQRRNGSKVGVSLTDFVITFKKKPS